jgi:hypothetical protein
MNLGLSQVAPRTTRIGDVRFILAGDKHESNIVAHAKPCFDELHRRIAIRTAKLKGIDNLILNSVI